MGKVLYCSGLFREVIDGINAGIGAEGGEIARDEATFPAMACHQYRDDAKAGRMLPRLGADDRITNDDHWDVRCCDLC